MQADRIPIGQQNKLQTILFRKPSDRQNVLNVKLGHPCSFKKVFPTAKHFEFKQYVQHSKTTTATLENLLRNATYPNLFAVPLSHMKMRPYLVNCKKNSLNC